MKTLVVVTELRVLPQVFGVTMRADIPLGIDLLSSFWKCLVGCPLEASSDLMQADILTYNYIKKIENVSIVDKPLVNVVIAAFCSLYHFTKNCNLEMYFLFDVQSVLKIFLMLI